MVQVGQGSEQSLLGWPDKALPCGTEGQTVQPAKQAWGLGHTESEIPCHRLSWGAWASDYKLTIQIAQYICLGRSATKIVAPQARE